jgi:GAF domain-containing protein
MSSPELELQSVFVSLGDALRPELDVIDTMDRVVEAATAHTSAVEAGIVLADARGALHVVGSTSERTSDVEEAQLGVDEGPCLETFRSGEPLEIPDLDQVRGEWPRFVAVADRRGFRASHTVPLTVRQQTVGALNLFAEQTGALTDEEAVLVQAIAQVATLALVRQRHDREAGMPDRLQRALDSRVVIEQAKGVIAEVQRVPIDHAFGLLRTRARQSGARLAAIAEQVVSTRRLPAG